MNYSGIGIGSRTLVGRSHIYQGGWGIFAAHNLKKNCIVAFYGGWPISNAEASTLLSMNAWSHIVRNISTGQCWLGAEYDDLYHLPPKYQEGKAQLANAADLISENKMKTSKKAGWWQDRYWWLLTPKERATPRTENLLPDFALNAKASKNVRAVYPSEPDSPILLVATRDIQKGEEVLWEYGTDYWTRMNDYSLQSPQLQGAQKQWWNTKRKELIYQHKYEANGNRLGPPRLQVTLNSEDYSLHIDAVEALLAFTEKQEPLPLMFTPRLLKIEDYEQHISSKTNALYCGPSGNLVGYVACIHKRPVLVVRGRGRDSVPIEVVKLN
jgi:hypothetical protein